jgi:hypothetical protein
MKSMNSLFYCEKFTNFNQFADLGIINSVSCFFWWDSCKKIFLLLFCLISLFSNINIIFLCFPDKCSIEEDLNCWLKQGTRDV